MYWMIGIGSGFPLVPVQYLLKIEALEFMRPQLCPGFRSHQDYSTIQEIVLLDIQPLPC